MPYPSLHVSELLEAFRAGDGVLLVRESVRIVMQEPIEADATDRNGSRPRLLATQAGDLELRIPKLRKGSFFPVILEPRRRIDQALYAVVMEAYVQGVSTRSVDDLVEALGGRLGVQQVRGLADLRRSRRDGWGVPAPDPWPPRASYVYLDATYVHVRAVGSNGKPGQVTSMAVVVAAGVAARLMHREAIEINDALIQRMAAAKGLSRLARPNPASGSR
ncbi:hypothetical protein GCM10023350_00100 [Nocardioides endophyticus]|uniref:Mutator family transposase n=1 Tax=Nocardioides endophyticus TaxID=1353775 RepID=A0ABP8Y6G0_9ACTN